MRIIQITDTHLSRSKPHFADNWAPLARWISGLRPDLVIHTGDVTVDGAEVEDDMTYAAGLLHELGVRWLAVPGNHDVGDAAHPRQPVNGERLASWHLHFGADCWIEDVDQNAGGWRIVGLDAMVLGSGKPEEAAQDAWLDAVMAQAAGRPIAWFLHKPLFLNSPEEDDTGYWSVAPQPRARLMALVRRYHVKLVASGHLHKAHEVVSEGTRFVWAPASSFLVGDMQPAMPGEKQLGAVLYELAGATIATKIVDVPGLREHCLDDVIQEVYPRPSSSAGSR